MSSAFIHIFNILFLDDHLTASMVGLRKDRRVVFNKKMALSKEGSEEWCHYKKELHIMDQTDEIHEQLVKYKKVHSEAAKLQRGYDQKGQDTYRHHIDSSPVRNVKVEFIMADSTKAVPEQLKQVTELPVSYKFYSDLVQNAPISRKTTVPV